MSSLTSQQRLMRLYSHEEMDRPAVIIRWWGFRDDPTAADLYRLMTDQADWVEPWTTNHLLHVQRQQKPGNPPQTPGRHPLQSIEDAERYLQSPMPQIGGDVAVFFRLQELVGERGIVLVHLGNNPGGQVAELFGSEQFALLSVLERELLHRMIQREQAIKLMLTDFLVAQGVGPFFGICGQEMIAPPLHGRNDFFEFNVRYDRAISERIHAAGGWLNVHCHGRVKTVIDGFPELGADVFHCFEAPPMGDITPAEAKAALRGQVALEGNLPIADLYERSADEIRAQTESLIHDCFDDRRGFAVSPTASPFIPGKGQVCYPQYQAMVETVLGASQNGRMR